MYYTFEIEHTAIIGKRKETNRFRLNYAVNLLRETGRKAYFYDKELKMHFWDKNALRFTYQIDLQNISLNLAQRLQKAAELIRGANYVYDWMELNVKAVTGRILLIENREELIKTWRRLRAQLANKYEGESANDYLTEIDEKLDMNKPVWEAAYCYQYFGLLFPHIPPQHHDELIPLK